MQKFWGYFRNLLTNEKFENAHVIEQFTLKTTTTKKKTKQFFCLTSINSF